jgi:hypothetical protein
MVSEPYAKVKKKERKEVGCKLQSTYTQEEIS